MFKGRLVRLIICLMIVAMLMVACAQATPEPTEVQPEEPAEVQPEEPEEAEVTCPPPTGTLVYANPTTIDSIEQAHASEIYEGNVGRQLTESLLFVTKDGELEPALAESWEVSDDGNEYTFHLREDVTFHNGEPFNAEAVVFTWETYSQPEVPESYNYTTANSAEVIDEFTVKITTEEPNPFFTILMALFWNIIPPEYYEEVGPEGFAAHPVGTGAFMFEEWVKGDKVSYVAYPNYWRECYPKLERITYRVIPESSSRVAALQTGEVHIAPRLSAEEAEGLSAEEDVEVLEYLVDRVYYVGFNNLTTGVGTPIEDQNVRLAMNYAVDVQEIIDKILLGTAQKAIGYVASTNLGYDGKDVFLYDPDKAKQLLAEAGYEDGFEIGMACPDSAFIHINEVCEAIAGYLGDVGINVDLEILDTSTFWGNMQAGELQPVFVDSWSGQTGEANQRLLGALGKDETWAQWYDEHLAELIASLGTTMDRNERVKIYEEIQEYMREEPPFIYLYELSTFEGVNKGVQDYLPSSSELHSLWFTSIEE